jgi:hypothetical protein
MAKQELFEAVPFELIEAREFVHNGERLMQVKGVMHRANELNGNHRIYPAPILSREVNKLNERLGSGDTMFSQADDPAGGVSRISDTAAMLTSVEYTPKHEVVGTAVILPTQKGKDLAAIVRAGGKVTIIARGFGTTRPGECAGQQGEVVQEGYELVTYEFVIGQSLGHHHQVPGPVVSSRDRKLTIKQEKFASSLIGPANGNQTQAARDAGYAGGPRQLAVQGSNNMNNPRIRQRIDEMLEGLVEPSVKTLAAALTATKRRAFLTPKGDIRYTDPEPDYKIMTETANRVLDRYERRSNRRATEPNVADTVHQQNQDCTEAVRQAVAGLDPTDRNLIRRTSEIDEKLAEIDHQLAEDDDGPERQGQN